MAPICIFSTVIQRRSVDPEAEKARGSQTDGSVGMSRSRDTAEMLLWLWKHAALHQGLLIKVTKGNEGSRVIDLSEELLGVFSERPPRAKDASRCFTITWGWILKSLRFTCVG